MRIMNYSQASNLILKNPDSAYTYKCLRWFLIWRRFACLVNTLHLKLFLFSLYKSVLWEEKKAKYSECTGKKEIFPSMVRKHFCLISQRKPLSLSLSLSFLQICYKDNFMSVRCKVENFSQKTTVLYVKNNLAFSQTSILPIETLPLERKVPK